MQQTKLLTKAKFTVASLEAWVNSNLLLFSLLVSLIYAILLFFISLNFPVSFDEAKAFLVAKKLLEGRTLWVDIHGGSNSTFFYNIHGLIINLLGSSYLINRGLNILLSSLAIFTFLYLIGKNLTKNQTFIPSLLFLSLFTFNPFIVAHTIPINHYSLSLSSLVLYFSFLLSYFYSRRDLKKDLILIFLFSCSITFSLYIRPHSGPLLLIAPFLIWKKKSYKRGLHLFSFFFFLFFFCCLFDYQTIKNLLLGKDVFKTIYFFTLNHRLYFLHNLFVMYLKQFDLIDGSEFWKMLFTFPVTNSYSSTNLNNIHYTLSYKIKSLLLQGVGFHVNSIFLLAYSFGIIPFFYKFKNKNNSLVYWTLISFSLLLTFLLFFLRYGESSSFSYFAQSILIFSLALMILFLGLYSSLETKQLAMNLTFVVLLLAFQNAVFLTPSRDLDNPYRFALRLEGLSPSSNPYSFYNLKRAAKEINKFTNKGDLVLLGHYAVSQYLKGKTINGLEMNIHKGFFKREFWDGVEYSKTPTLSGITSSYVYHMLIKNRSVKAILDDGTIHEDFLKKLSDDNLYCIAFLDPLFKIYTPCSSE